MIESIAGAAWGLAVLGILLRIEHRLGAGETILDSLKRLCPIFTRSGCPMKPKKEVEEL